MKPINDRPGRIVSWQDLPPGTPLLGRGPDEYLTIDQARQLRDALTAHIGDGDIVAISRVADLTDKVRKGLCSHPSVTLRGDQMECSKCGTPLTREQIERAATDTGRRVRISSLGGSDDMQTAKVKP